MLKAGGRGGVVIKNTFLSNTDNASVSLRKLLLESCNLHTVLDCPGGTFQGAGVKTVVLFFEKGAPTRKVWFYQLDPGRNLGKTNPLNDADLAEFVKLQKTFADSPKSWSVDAKSIDKTTFDLSVKNPNGGEEVTHRSPAGDHGRNRRAGCRERGGAGAHPLKKFNFETGVFFLFWPGTWDPRRTINDTMKSYAAGGTVKLAKGFFADIRGLVVSARTTVARGVDLVQVHTNFEIGRRIVEQEQKGKGRAAYGKEVIKALAERLTGEFGKGFSTTNLAYMRTFYLVYQDRTSIPQTASGELGSGKIFQSATGKSALSQTQIGITSAGTKARTGQTPTAQRRPFTLSWTNYVFLLGIKNSNERSFYEIEAARQDWTVGELKRQFDSSLYERLALSRDTAGIRKLAKRGQLVEKPQDIFKEPLVLEFLGLGEHTRYSESDLETAVINRIEHFLLELGKGFLFEARQKRFTFDGDHFFVDLVFYNRLLRSYVLVDLKIGHVTHQDLGQMQMYVNYFDRHVKTKAEHATIGIVLCKKQNEALVEITLPRGANIHAREYQLYLPSKKELQQKLQEWAEEAGGWVGSWRIGAGGKAESAEVLGSIRALR